MLAPLGTVRCLLQRDGCGRSSNVTSRVGALDWLLFGQELDHMATWKGTIMALRKKDGTPLTQSAFAALAPNDSTPPPLGTFTENVYEDIKPRGSSGYVGRRLKYRKGEKILIDTALKGLKKRVESLR